MRIQKYLANHSPYSRRQAEAMIQAGLITVNHQVIHLGHMVHHGDLIFVEGNAIKVSLKRNLMPEVLMMNKPLGVICSRTDDKMRTTIYDLLPDAGPKPWIMVGRLDVNTSGLILFTTDGDLAHQLMHPSSQLIRRYHVRVFGESKPSMLQQLLAGVVIDGKKMRFQNCKLLSQQSDGVNQWYEVEVSSGQYRMIRRLWESQGMKVSRLVRVAYGSLRLPKGLRLGDTLLLSSAEVQALMQEVSGA